MRTVRALIIVASVLAMAIGWAVSAALLLAGFLLFLLGLGLDMFESSHSTDRARDALAEERAVEASLYPAPQSIDFVTPLTRRS